MRNPLANWLEERTGLGSATREGLDRPVAGGARWGHSLGFALAASLVVEAVTGLLLMTTYSPSTSTAWGSVYYITYHMDLGWFVRGVHRFGSYASVVVGGLFLLRLVLSGAYRAPREVNWWLAVAAVLLVLGLGVTGNILPWDQRGYWAAVVETTIAGGTPGAGPAIKKLVVGGTDFGNLTITRIYGIHVALLPGLLALCLWAYRALFRRHGFAEVGRAGEAEPFWPRQAFFHLASAFAVLGAVIALTVYYHGYSLDAPADPSAEDYPARPEWYFLGLYQLLKAFRGREVIATMIIPGAVVSTLILLPLLDRAFSRRVAYSLSCAAVLTIAGGAGYLTYEAMAKDAHSVEFRKARDLADRAGARAVSLADREGIPPEGSAYILMRDPLARGGAVFARKCLGCHGLGGEKHAQQWAPDLDDFGSYAWIRGLLEAPDSPRYFGKAPQCGGMKEWKESSELTPGQLDEVAAFVATFAAIPPEVTPGEWAADPKVKGHPGRVHFQNECVGCHTMGDPSTRARKLQPAPDLFAWGSDRWTARMIKEPGSANYYGYLEEEQKMPAFGSQLTDADLATLVRYLKGDYQPPPRAPVGSRSESVPIPRLPQ